MGEFDAGRLNVKMPRKKCIHAQISVQSFYGTLMIRQVDVQSQQKLPVF